MSTEEDTFNALRRTPYNQLYAEYTELLISHFGGGHPVDAITNLVERHGWTLDQFSAEWELRTAFAQLSLSNNT